MKNVTTINLKIVAQSNLNGGKTMKIVSVDIMKVPSEDPSFSGNSQGSKEDWCPLVIRINTDTDICGFGEAGLAYGKGWRGGFGMLQDFSQVIIGEDPLNIEKIWDKLFNTTYWGIAGGVVVNAAISAIDIALWDIKGKYYNTPTYEILSGKTKDHLRAYASQLQYNWGEQIDKLKLITPEDYAEVTKKVMSEGYDALKFDPIMLSDQPDGGGVASGILKEPSPNISLKLLTIVLKQCVKLVGMTWISLLICMLTQIRLLLLRLVKHLRIWIFFTMKNQLIH